MAAWFEVEAANSTREGSRLQRMLILVKYMHMP